VYLSTRIAQIIWILYYFQLNQIRLEREHIQLLEEETEKKIENYQQISRAVYLKLNHLWLQGNQFFSTNYCKYLHVRNFISSVREDWRCVHNMIEREEQTVQLVSCTNPSMSSYIKATCQAHHNCNTEMTSLSINTVSLILKVRVPSRTLSLRSFCLDFYFLHIHY
jgi:hypothetical protein